MNKRLRQIEIMFSQVAKIPKEQSRAIILETKTGKMIMEENSTVLYEQQTENLYSIATELTEIPEYKHLSSYFTIKAIVDANKFLVNNPSILRKEQLDELSAISPSPDLKLVQRSKLKKQKQLICSIQKRGLIQAKRRTIHVIGTEN